MVPGKLDIYLLINVKWSSFLTLHKNQLQVDQGLQNKTWNSETATGNKILFALLYIKNILRRKQRNKLIKASQQSKTTENQPWNKLN